MTASVCLIQIVGLGVARVSAHEYAKLNSLWEPTATKTPTANLGTVLGSLRVKKKFNIHGGKKTHGILGSDRKTQRLLNGMRY
jgi:hypothetical protein